MNGQSTECVTNAVCQGSQCTCNSDYYVGNNMCNLKKKPGESCTMNGQSTECVTNAVCQGSQCTCNSDYYVGNNMCNLKKKPGESCTMNGQPTECVTNAVCQGSQCTCNSDYYVGNNMCNLKKKPGESCTMNGQPTECVTNAVCQGSQCTCNSDYYVGNNMCNLKKKPGESCTMNGQPTECVTNAVCQGSQCTCNSDYYVGNNMCNLKRKPGESCTMNGQPTECVTNAVCQGSQCTCNSDYYVGNNMCNLKRKPGESCTMNGQPTECVTNAVCQGSQCTCNSDYYVGNNMCNLKRKPGESCTMNGQPTECVTNAVCQGSQCTCNSDYYVGNNMCNLKRKPGESCTMNGQPTECVTNAVCQGSQCTCNSDYYVGNNMCNLKRKPGESCTMNGQPTECVTNAVCQGSQCTCNSDYYVGSNMCNLKIPLDASCTSNGPSNPCKDPMSSCIFFSSAYLCKCNAGYYNNGGTCNNMSELQVIDLNVPDATTTETSFLVTWINPPGVSYINKYQITLSAAGQTDEGPFDINTSDTQYNATRKVPGRRYTITISSVETLSRPSLQTIDKTVQDGTKPAKPGNIIQQTFTATTETFSWTINGDLQYFSGVINDTSVSPNTFNLTNIPGQPPSLPVENLKFGAPYTFTVVSHSNGFSSQPQTQTIRTLPTTPGFPLNFACTANNIFDRSMTLTWDEPPVPNGYIQYYIIYDGIGTKIQQTNGSVLFQKIENLQPQHYYNFAIATVNDAAVNPISVRTNSIACVTKAALASPPQNFNSAGVTARTISVQWNYPSDPGGNVWGYRIHVYNQTSTRCVQQIILQCTTGCNNVQNIVPDNICTSNSTENVKYEDVIKNISYNIVNLAPYITYKVEVQAVNLRGDGNIAVIEKTTNQEAPKEPTQVQGLLLNDPKTIQVSWLHPYPRPGITNYTIKVYEQNDEGTEFIYKEMLSKVIRGFYTMSDVVGGLEEYWQYKFKVEAKTVIGTATSNMSAPVRTKSSTPGMVENLGIKNPPGTFTQIEVTWSIPSLRDRNGVIVNYKLEHNITGVTPYTMVIPANSSQLSKTLNVKTEQYYMIAVYAVNNESQNGIKNESVYYAKPGPPETPSVPAVVEGAQSIVVTSQTTITVKLTLDWFLNEKNGMRTDGGVLVCPGTACTNYGKNTGVKSSFTTVYTWKQSKKEGFTKPYRATNTSWVNDHKNALNGRRKRSNQEVTLTIGEDTNCDKMDETVVCNGPLPAGKSFIVVAFVCTSGGCTESEQFGPYATQAVPDDGAPIAAIGGAVGGAVVVVVVIVIIMIVIRRTRNKKERMDPVGEDDFDPPGKPVVDPVPDTKNIKKNRPIRMDRFADHVEDLHRDSNLKFAHEYEDIKALTDPKILKGVTLAETEDNKLKNRYVNILPYDRTIVKLLPLEDDDENSSTFINANYIRGYNSQREYIASQGPIPSTIDDFWRMIWEQNVSIIVMLTLCKEEGRIKCECYWPTDQSDPKQYGDIVVEMKTSSTINTFDYKIFDLSVGDRTRTVKHFHFLNWKDFQANVQNDVMIDFIHNVRNHVTVPESRVPMVVHCSAGVGRTGTYIALDHLMQYIHEHNFSDEIDIFDLVVKMRECRMYMVQTEQQYIFIHDCIKDILERKRIKELEGEGNLYGNEDMYANSQTQENIYDNQAFEPDVYQNVDLKGSEQRSDL